MEFTKVFEESVRFGKGGRLAGVLHYPASATPRRAVVLCSPHPNFAGDMNNNVILSLAEVLAARNIVLRFDYRGVGDSKIDLPPNVSVLDYWEEVEQSFNYTDALEDTADAVAELWRINGKLSMSAVGYSFGGAMATCTAQVNSHLDSMVAIAPPLKRISFDFLSPCSKPCLIIAGKNDFVYQPDVAAELVARAGELLDLQIIEGADHFFRGQEAEIAKQVANFISQPVRSTAH